MNNERKMSYVMEYQFFVRKRKDIQNLNHPGLSFGLGCAAAIFDLLNSRGLFTEY